MVSGPVQGRVLHNSNSLCTGINVTLSTMREMAQKERDTKEKERRLFSLIGPNKSSVATGFSHFQFRSRDFRIGTPAYCNEDNVR